MAVQTSFLFFFSPSSGLIVSDKKKEHKTLGKCDSQPTSVLQSFFSGYAFCPTFLEKKNPGFEVSQAQVQIPAGPLTS